MNDEYKEVMLVGQLRKVLSSLSDSLGGRVDLLLGKESKEKLAALEAKYDAFYELPIQERMYLSGMLKRPKE